MNTHELKALNDYLKGFVTPGRAEKIDQVLSLRQRHVTVMLEDIYQPHNASAVLRSCDAFGIQHVHIVENRNSYRINPDVELGTAQWLTLHHYREKENNTPDAIRQLKESGYRIIATAPHSRDCLLEDLSIEKGPMALMFGTELNGLSDTALDLADEFVRIPMHGFVESFNISVSAAICLSSLDRRLRDSRIPIQPDAHELQEIRHQWYRNSLKRPDQLIRAYGQEKTHG
ncbi:TrmH family RNA methyltransferase [Salinispira pacifica]|uniref:TrmH family RNA methyltransferase n=1 Tax=Salinispira pacifica TaxID=1307761 RepID=UPI0011842FA2|nr:RNA methyltransferase [Salinispira pacifica]